MAKQEPSVLPVGAFKISLKQLAYFIAVAESGSISKALTSLVTRSVVTEAIRKLEETLGAELCLYAR